jgi:hypothetical protein
MPAESLSHLVTAEELLGISIPGTSTELVRGALVVRELPSADGFLDGEDMLPGFSCALAEVVR